jgi:hypothetical protein
MHHKLRLPLCDIQAQKDPSWETKFDERRENGQITTSDLMWFALQIAKALQFLSERNVANIIYPRIDKYFIRNF